MPIVKVWSSSRSIKKLISAANLTSVIQIGKEKFGFQAEDGVKVVMESDGTEVEDEEVFSCLVSENLFPQTVLLLMKCNETWSPHQQEDNRDLQKSSTEIQVPPSSFSPSLTSSPSSNSSEDIGAESDKFIIPWGQFPKDLLTACVSNQVPSPKHVRQLVRNLIDEVISFTPKPKRSLLGAIAREVINKYPTLGLQQNAMYDHERLFDQLENRLRNVQRSANQSSLKSKLSLDLDLDVPDDIPVSKKNTPRKIMSLGCIQWQPDYPEGENESTQSSQKEWLREQHKLSTSADKENIIAAMTKTYPSQRVIVNKQSPISVVVEEWPYLFDRYLFFRHANILLGKNIFKVWRTELEIKLPMLVNFFQNCSKMLKVMKSVEIAVAVNESKVPEEAGLIPMLTTYFDEDVKSIIRYFEITCSADDITKSLDTPLPIIAVLGSSVLNNEKAFVIVEKEVVGDLGNVIDVMPLYFACFYVFNMEYPPSAGASLEFLQRIIMKINPEGSGNRRGPGHKKRTKVHPKVLSLLSNLQQKESVWNISS